MEITSFYFVLFSIIAILIYYLLNHKFRTGFVALLSCGFIASYSYYLLIYVLFYSLINFYIGFRIHSTNSAKTWFRIGIIINLLQLVILRYASFVIDPIFQVFNSSLHISIVSEIIVPVGVSYFTMQGIGYLFNIKMGWEIPEKRFLDFLLFITFYPKFLSGPIERSNRFLPQLKAVHPFDRQRVADGLRMAFFGFFKKIAIANQIYPFLSSTYANLDSASSSSLWILIIIQPLCLYFDFSAYTDIAVGTAKTFGIELQPNFNKPFFSENMTNFWKRFHISLSSWFNDYIFKQASFKYRRWGIYASVYALMLTWTLFGIWHGAGWNFMILGFVQALAIIYEFFTKKWRVKLFSGMSNNLRIWLSRLITFIFYGTSLVFFFSPDIDTTFLYFSRLFNTGSSVVTIEYPAIPFTAVILMIIFLLIEYISNDFESIFKRMTDIWSAKNKHGIIFRWVTYSMLALILFFVGKEFQQFIYAQF
jgi:D-alanyl-lipoteichoic acid acyltransferase DltB (MBOAT superfamily)